MFDTVLIANRGAIAVRILRTLKTLGARSVAVYSESDFASLHVERADEAISLGEGAAAATYLDAAKILAAAKTSGAQAIHPGYGFLSENARFAEAVEAAGLAFIGPTPQQMRAFGLKHTARALAKANGLPLLEGTELLDSLAHAHTEAERVGYPVMLKSTAGGGGIGMRVCRSADELAAQFDAVKRLSENNFRDAGVFLEQYITRARHIEVQIFGDGKGAVIALGERDCSVQRRNQKVIEETPAPGLSDALRAELQVAAIKLAAAVDYRNAGTVEFVYDDDAQRFYFLEVNTRLQVEHGVTEQVFGVDLVSWMLKLASGDLPPLSELAAALKPQGHAMQARVYAEDPGRDFRPSPGRLSLVRFPQADGHALRIDTWVRSGSEVPPWFDPMIAKVIVHANTREQARAALDEALARTELYGLETNRDYLRQILAFAPYVEGRAWTRCLEGLHYRPHTLEVLAPGTQTTVQDWPGRLRYWDVGIPPSGPMDDRALRLGNALLGNPPEAAAFEITLAGPTLRFNTDAVIAVTGASLPVTLDGDAVAMNVSLLVDAGSTLAIGRIAGAGARAYLCIRGGVQLPDYLGSRSTFTLGQFGGHGGRALAASDVLHLLPLRDRSAGAQLAVDCRLPAVRELRVLYGPHAAPEYFTAAYMQRFFDADWEVHFNSSRTGVRLIGPKPEWVREDGGEAGLHPSNIHDNAYAIGAVDFTGDMPVILGPDGPSLGGFVCPVTVIEADLWQLGQLKAGDKLRFVEVSYEAARELFAERLNEIEHISPSPACGGGVWPIAEWHWPLRDQAKRGWGRDDQSSSATNAPIPAFPRLRGKETSNVLHSPILLETGSGSARLVARLSGDTHLLLEFGDAELDLALRFRVDALMTAFVERKLDGVVDVTPGVRSLQIHYQPPMLTLQTLLDEVAALWRRFHDARDIRLPSRIVHLPLSWDDPATKLAIEKYMTTVRPNAPWCPSNLEFIRRVNGLASIDEVKRIVFDASYLVLGLGDVYLGAPVATPLDPRHRLVTTKYNPARTWTPENAVGIGGAYMCVYGMEGPGGYQFVGRTLQMWNRNDPLPAFDGQPYLLRFFDQIRFYEVSAEELLEIRRRFPLGRYPLRIEESTLDLAEYEAFLEQQAESIAAFRDRQRAAFNDERAHWAATGLAHFESQEAQAAPADAIELEDGEQGVYSPVAGNLWQLQAQVGQQVAAGEVVAVLEAMKMEIQVVAPASGLLRRCFVQPGSSLQAGTLMLTIEERAA
ncbi:5-oxoprolinase/urea amidolyase family protein [Hydrocarboniphaga sp.]|uniref:5-oxoprolinase/urea amidolyase family protein n=1 Tax=Hydrocarboniphaga sp. TaxID=2033016 RepID=UPI00262AA870|nr:5-oxoprolinase/urea amidolyase family protein [Hydrocarboniphaga sp.]